MQVGSLPDLRFNMKRIIPWSEGRSAHQAKVARCSTRMRENKIRDNPTLKRERIKNKSTGGNAITVFRINLNISQTELAKALGCTKHTVANWEHGRSQPKRSFRAAMDRMAKKNEIDCIDWELYDSLTG